MLPWFVTRKARGRVTQILKPLLIDSLPRREEIRDTTLAGSQLTLYARQVFGKGAQSSWLSFILNSVRGNLVTLTPSLH